MKQIRFTDGERHVFRKRPYEPLSEWAAANLLVKDGPYAGGRYRKDVNPYLVEIMFKGQNQNLSWLLSRK